MSLRWYPLRSPLRRDVCITRAGYFQSESKFGLTLNLNSCIDAKAMHSFAFASRPISYPNTNPTPPWSHPAALVAKGQVLHLLHGGNRPTRRLHLVGGCNLGHHLQLCLWPPGHLEGQEAGSEPTAGGLAHEDVLRCAHVGLRVDGVDDVRPNGQGVQR